MKKRIIFIVICVMIVIGIAIGIWIVRPVIARQAEYRLELDGVETEGVRMVRAGEELYGSVEDLCKMLHVESEWDEEGKALKLTTTEEYVMISEEVAINIADAVIEQITDEKYLNISVCKIVEENDGQYYKVMRSIEGVFGSAYSVTIAKKDGKVVDVSFYD